MIRVALFVAGMFGGLAVLLLIAVVLASRVWRRWQDRS